MRFFFVNIHPMLFLQVDSHKTLADGVVVQVSGELSNNGQPMRRFVQTFVLAPQSPKKYYVHNDIFRYQVWPLIIVDYPINNKYSNYLPSARWVVWDKNGKYCFEIWNGVLLSILWICLNNGPLYLYTN